MHSLSVTRTSLAAGHVQESNEGCDGKEPNTVAGYVEQAQQHCKDGYFSQALQLIHLALGMEPTADELLMQRSEIITSLEPWEDALDVLDETIQDEPQHIHVWIARGLSQGQVGDHDQAYDDFTQAIALHTSSCDISLAQIHLYRASSACKLCWADKALSDYHTVLASHPDCAVVLARLGCLLHQLGRHEEALEHLNRAILIDPRSASYRYSRAMISHALGQSDLSLQDLNQALLHQRECTKVLMLRGEIYLSLSDDDAALEDWSKILTIEPLHVQALLQRGQLLKQQEQWEAAIDDLSRLISLHPGLIRPYLYRSECYEALDKVPQATSDALAALRCAQEGMPEIDALEDMLQRLGYEGPSMFPLPEAPSRAELLTYMEQMPQAIFDEIQEFHQKACSSMRACEEDMAVLFYDAAIALDPELFDSFLGRAQAFKRLGLFEQALYDLGYALQLCPNSAHALFQRSLIQYDLGNLAEALSDVKAAIALFPFSIDYHNQCGLLCMLLGHWKEAILAFEEVLLLDPIDTAAISQLGHLCLVIQWTDRAIEWYDLLLELSPDDSEAWLKRGEAYAQVEDWVQALLDWEEALSLEPTEPSLYMMNCKAHLKIRQPWFSLEDVLAVLHFSNKTEALHQEAQDLYQTIVASLPQATIPDSEWCFPNIERLLQTSEEEHALALIHSMLLCFPDNPLLWCLKGRAHHALYDYDKAQSSFQQALENENKHPETLFYLGCFLSDRGQYQEAITALNKAIRFCFDRGVLHEAYYQLGVSYKHTKRYKESLIAFTKATSYKPDHPFSWLSRAEIEGLLHRATEAIASLNKAIILAPELSAPWFQRALQYAKIGRKDATLRDLKQAIQRNSRYRREAMGTSIFASLWNDTDFIAMVSE